MTKNPQEEIVSKINSLVKDNEKLEKEIEKLRRTKENDREQMNKLYEDLDKKRKEKKIWCIIVFFRFQLT